MSELILPQWPQPLSVRSCVTTRQGGVSQPPYDSLNLGLHVGDDPKSVITNRQRLIELAALPSVPYWLEQVHGTQVIRLTQTTSQVSPLVADAVYSNQSGVVCCVMTADCLPVLFTTRAGDEVAAAHAGWRGLCAGILENIVAEFSAQPADIMAWFGPAIGPQQFEVGEEVREAFMAIDPLAARAFVSKGHKFLADIYQLARLRLRACGVTDIYGGEFCTVSDSTRFYSYRREVTTGRLASLIWLI